MKRKKLKKAQIGIDNRPMLNINNSEPNYSWMNTNTSVVRIPGEPDPMMNMAIDDSQTEVGPDGKIVPFDRKFRTVTGTGRYNNHPAVDTFNGAAQLVTGVANTIGNNKLKRQEQLQMLESMSPTYWENMEGEGLNNLPMYTQAGGGPGKNKAKEMLRDGIANGKKLTAKQKRYFGWIAGGKKQTGGPADGPKPGQIQVRRLQPTEMQQWNQFLDFVKEQGYEGSPELNTKNKNLGSSLFEKFKSSNPGISINYDIVPSVQAELQVLRDNAQSFAKRRNDPNAENLMANTSPVDGWFGSKTSQYRFPSLTTNTFKDGTLVESSDLGLVDSNLKPTGVGKIDRWNPNSLKRNPNQNRVTKLPDGVRAETLYDENGQPKGMGYTDPKTGDIVELQNGGESEYSGPVEAEEGEIAQMGDDKIIKISDSANRHEQGGVKLDNVKRVLEDTSDKRKDRASKLLLMDKDEVEGLFNFKPKSKLSHAKAFELAKKHYRKQRDKVNRNNKVINERENIDKYSAKSIELNFKNMEEIPTDQDAFDALFMHQEAVKSMNGIGDDGKIAKTGCGPKKFRIAQAGTGTVGQGFTRPPRGASGWYFDEGTQKWYKPGTVPNPAAPAATSSSTSGGGGVTPYTGGRTAAGRTTPTGNPNAFGYEGGLDAFKTAWSPILNLDQYGSAKDAQQATYNYLVKNQPDVAASIWKDQGLTQKGRDMMNPSSKSYDPAFARVAGSVFDNNGKLKPGANLTPDQLEALTPAYVDNMLGIRSVTPSQNSITDVTPDPGTPAAPAARTPLDASVKVNPTFRNQPANGFNEPIYGDELAPGVLSYVDSLRRDPELFNPVQLNQLKYKLMDPTAALNANQADFNAVAEGLDPANTANLLGQKYSANAQVMANYDNQNVGIKNREIDYNTSVRDRQSVADAQNRGAYHRNVQLARENQRQQRLKSVEDISRVIQLKRRQNRSGNLIQKLSPAFDQYGEYNGYQYLATLPSELGIGNDTLPTVKQTGKKSRTRTTTTWKLGDRTVKTETSS